MSETVQIPLQELRLPETGEIVMLSKYVTTGQSRELQRVMLKGGQFDVEAGKMQTLQVDTFFEMQDKAAELLIKEVKDKDGNVHSFSREWLYGLPVSDGNLIYEKLNEITALANPGGEIKKK